MRLGRAASEQAISITYHYHLLLGLEFGILVSQVGASVGASPCRQAPGSAHRSLQMASFLEYGLDSSCEDGISGERMACSGSSGAAIGQAS